jgi:SAM-dependent methyltransferase
MSVRELYVVQNLPVFQNKMYSNQADAIDCPKGNIRLVQDMETGLIFNQDFDESLMTYDADYQNEQAHSQVFQAHLDDVKAIIDRCFLTKEFIEVGCGKGYFLEHMAASGYRVVGFDPTYEGCNKNVIKQYFDPASKEKSEGIVLRHVLEHVQDPYSFLKQVAESNNNRGLIYIEVPCFDWICSHNAWFDIFYEHVNYFRLADFHRLFDKIIESGNIFGGQYLYVVADLSTLKIPKITELDYFNFPASFLTDFDRLASHAKGKTNAVWGGASKGVIFSLYMRRANVNIDYVIDINPAKQNKFIAATGLLISSPNSALKNLKSKDNMFVMNSNYFEEIIGLSDNKFDYIKVD